MSEVDKLADYLTGTKDEVDTVKSKLNKPSVNVIQQQIVAVSFNQEERTEVWAERNIGNAWIVGSPTNGLVGANTGTVAGTQQIVGGGGMGAWVNVRILNPNNIFVEEFDGTDFIDTVNSTCSYGAGSAIMEPGEILQSNVIALNNFIVDNCDNTNWSLFPDSTLSRNLTTYKTGVCAINAIKAGTTTNYFAAYKTTPSVDFTGRTIRWWIYIKDAAALAKINYASLGFGSDSSNFYYWNVLNASLTTGWNYLTGTISNKSGTIGTSVVDTDCKFVRVSVYTNLTSNTFAAGDIVFDDISLDIDVYSKATITASGYTQKQTNGVHYKFSGDGANSSSNGSGFDLTATNVTYPMGKMSQCARFDGVTYTHTNLQKAGLSLVGADWSVAFWIYASSIGASNTFFHYQVAGAGADINTIACDTYSSAYFRVFCADSTGSPLYKVVKGATTIASRAGLWTHVCFTYDGSVNKNLKLYINGVEDTPYTVNTTDGGFGNMTNTSRTLSIGEDVAGNYPSNSYIDDVRLFPRVISAAELANIYNSGNGTETPTGSLTYQVSSDGGSTWETCTDGVEHTFGTATVAGIKYKITDNIDYFPNVTKVKVKYST